MEEKTKNGEKALHPKKRSKGVILLLAFVFILGGGVFGAYHFYGEKILKKGKNEEIQKVQKKENGKTGIILTLDPFLLNLSGSAQRYAKISISVELKDKKTLEQAKKVVPAIRDRIIYVISSKTAESLLDVTEREKIKEEIKEKLKGLFDDMGSIKYVYITDIVVQ